MKTIGHFLAIALSAAVLLTGCQYDDSDLWDEVNSQAARIAALEAWQKSVNNEIASLQGLITALEGNDYVTGVTPFTTPAPGGYTITFTKSAPVTIYHGSKGETGDTGDTGAAGSTPVIGVAEYPAGSGVYYWTVNGEWLTDDGTPTGNKVPVTGERGADGTTPTVEIGANGNWFINGVDTGVKATGADGSTPVITIGANGNWYVNGVDTGVKAQGNDGATPTVEIGVNGNWFINGVDTGVKATGADGSTPVITIGANGNWYVNGVDTGVKAQGNDGTNGSTPKVIIGSDGYWYISADGTATGTPPDPGSTGWVSTGVKATGDKGDKGDDGDSMFAGVDDTNDDYVIITLNDGPPATIITLPKYKTIGISFVPLSFLDGQTKDIEFQSTGSDDPTNIRIVDVPAGWSVTVNLSGKKFTVTAPATVAGNTGEATVLVADGDRVAAMYALPLSDTGPAANEVGAVYYQNGVAAGIVYAVGSGLPYDPNTVAGRVVSLDEGVSLQWADFNDIVGGMGNRGGYNMFNAQRYMNNNGKSWSNFPAFAWVDQKNGPSGTTNYNPERPGLWYLPAIDELKVLCAVWNSDRTTFNGWLTGQTGGQAISAHYYWSSTEASNLYAWGVDFGTGVTSFFPKGTRYRVRAVLAF